jgi:hypothetical protein
MKIQILKSGSTKGNAYGTCPMFIDVPPDGNNRVKTYATCPMFIDVPPDGVDVRRPEQK